MNRLTDDQVVQLFGDPRPYVQDDGTIGPMWERTIIAYATLPAPLPLAWNHAITVTRFKCHQLLRELFTRVMQALFDEPAVWATIDDFGGCYDWRLRRNSTDALSRHAFAIAIDLDVADNPYGRAPKVDPRTVEIFAAHGFLWGGTFTGRCRDGMHFEFADPAKL